MKWFGIMFMLSALLATGIVSVAGAGPGNISITKHNLSASGTGDIKTTAVGEGICVFCHTPHNSSNRAPLWNRSDTTTSYQLYNSSTFDAAPSQPNGASRLCLSCHDGTIAVGLVLSRQTPIPMAGGITTIPSGRSTNLGGANLANDHPVSFVYDSNLAATDGELADPSALTGAVKLDAAGRLQCTSCHDPHDGTNGKFLVMDNSNAALCTTCHNVAGWAQSPHRTSTATWNGSGTNPWAHTAYTTVAANGCMNCHNVHSAGKPERLLTQPNDEDVCLACHDGSVAAKNLVTEFGKSTRHDVGGFSGVHDPTEDPLFMNKHVECADCHDPHRSYQGAVVAAPGVPKNMEGVSGVNSSGTRVATASFGYEICYKCHADNSVVSTPFVDRQIVQTNTRLEFSTANPSYHPVEASGKNNDVPSLISPRTEMDIISCTDCHTTDSSTRKGTHGSDNPFLLKWNYATADHTKESAQAYALCYSCHSRTDILNDRSFGKHDKHIRGEDAPCSVCHDSHGINSAQGSATRNTNLINFDTNVVTASSNGRLEFLDQGSKRGECSLTCHGKDHKGKGY